MTTFLFALSLFLTPCPAGDTLTLLLAKSSSRNWRSESEGGYTARIAGGLFVCPVQGALYPEHSVPLHCLGQLCGGLHAHRFLQTGTPTRMTALFLCRLRRSATGKCGDVPPVLTAEMLNRKNKKYIKKYDKNKK